MNAYEGIISEVPLTAVYAYGPEETCYVSAPNSATTAGIALGRDESGSGTQVGIRV